VLLGPEEERELCTFIAGFFNASKDHLYVVTKQTHAARHRKVSVKAATMKWEPVLLSLLDSDGLIGQLIRPFEPHQLHVALEWVCKRRINMVERFKTHSFEQKIERGDPRFTWCVNCIHVFLLSNLTARIGQYTGSGIGWARTGGEDLCSMTLTDLLGA